MLSKSNKPKFTLWALENILKWAQINFIIKMCMPGVCNATVRLSNRGPWAEPAMSGSKEPGGPTYVTDGLTSGATGPSPEHCGAPPKGGVQCGVGGSYPCGNVGAAANGKQTNVT